MTVRNIQLLDVVALTVDLPQDNLWRGQVGTVVEVLADGQALEVEFSDSPVGEAAPSHWSHVRVIRVASRANYAFAF